MKILQTPNIKLLPLMISHFTVTKKCKCGKWQMEVWNNSLLIHFFQIVKIHRVLFSNKIFKKFHKKIKKIVRTT